MIDEVGFVLLGCLSPQIEEVSGLIGLGSTQVLKDTDLYVPPCSLATVKYFLAALVPEPAGKNVSAEVANKAPTLIDAISSAL